jgi:hypothetical protein
MIGSERKTCVHATCSHEDRRRRIRDLNDGLRRYARAGIICVTAGVQALGSEGVEAALLGARDFDAFTPDNDPYDEHDFGSFKAAGERMLWKIDYYDRERRFGSPDPADPAVTTRVLTIMLTSEY